MKKKMLEKIIECAKGDAFFEAGEYRKAIECYLKAGAIGKALDCWKERGYLIRGSDEYLEKIGIARKGKEELKKFGKKLLKEGESLKACKCFYFAGEREELRKIEDKIEEGLKEREGIGGLDELASFYKETGQLERIPKIISIAREKFSKMYPGMEEAIDIVLGCYKRGEIRSFSSCEFQLYHLKKTGRWYVYGVA